MNLLDLVELLEFDNIDLISYASPLKIVAIGKILNFSSSTKIIDFGCGRGDALTLWGKYFNISGEGIELDDVWCNQANEKLQENSLSNRIKIICEDATKYEFEKETFDVASCLGASMIWGGFKSTLQNMKRAIHKEGTVIIGEPYYTDKDIPKELIELEGDHLTESEILNVIRQEGFELKFVKRANTDDKDSYRARFSGELQEDSIRYMKDYYYGWGIYVLKKK